MLSTRLSMIFCAAIMISGQVASATIEERIEALEKEVLNLKKLLTTTDKNQTSGQAISSTSEPKIAPRSASECINAISQDARMIESRGEYIDLGWLIEFQNSCDQVFGGYAEITFYDQNEFELDSDRSDPFSISPNSTRKISGKLLIKRSVASDIAKSGAGFRSR